MKRSRMMIGLQREACSFLCCLLFSVIGSNDAIEECSIGLNITYQLHQMIHHTAFPFCTYLDYVD